MASGFLSSVGNWIYIASMTILCFQNFGTLGVATFGMIRQIPYIFLSPLSGFLIDRFSRRSLLIVVNFLSLVAMLLVIVLSFSGTQSLAGYVVAILIMVFIGTVEYPLRLTLVTNIVDKESLLATNTLSNALATVSLMVAPSIASLITSTQNISWTFLANLGFFIASFAIVFLIPRSVDTGQRVKAPAEKSIRQSVRNTFDGFVFILHARKIFAISLLLCLIHIIVGAILVLIPHIADTIGHAEAGVGYLMTANGCGSFLGALSGAYLGKKSLNATVWISTIGTCAACVLGGLFSGVFIAYSSVLLIGFFASLGEGPILTLIQKGISDTNAGRVFAAIDVLIIGGMGLGSMLVGLLFTHFSFSLTLYVVGALPLIALLALNKQFVSEERSSSVSA